MKDPGGVPGSLVTDSSGILLFHEDFQYRSAATDNINITLFRLVDSDSLKIIIDSFSGVAGNCSDSCLTGFLLEFNVGRRSRNSYAYGCVMGTGHCIQRSFDSYLDFSLVISGNCIA